jgi:hypothetical protein
MAWRTRASQCAYLRSHSRDPVCATLPIFCLSAIESIPLIGCKRRICRWGICCDFCQLLATQVLHKIKKMNVVDV